MGLRGNSGGRSMMVVKDQSQIDKKIEEIQTFKERIEEKSLRSNTDQNSQDESNRGNNSNDQTIEQKPTEDNQSKSQPSFLAWPSSEPTISTIAWLLREQEVQRRAQHLEAMKTAEAEKVQQAAEAELRLQKAFALKREAFIEKATKFSATAAEYDKIERAGQRKFDHIMKNISLFECKLRKKVKQLNEERHRMYLKAMKQLKETYYREMEILFKTEAESEEAESEEAESKEVKGNEAKGKEANCKQPAQDEKARDEEVKAPGQNSLPE
ncbi:uncharacterized protein A1O5_01128 [Cladophialophora psammophila CBS 110553]|uniref:Uncharacterized protein n=1 Tax=Cladophialophora psammophila CBS 110553 TaxID=1182543 RepID=W9XH01_9EURO|nr:uncharacterized protein A1O5_01128 [Cladophialophora psammophila CBS 110553]EXJ76620.1 hypothetical protein A1O5_01128 [Cladophialophora psammophila CBS 110553]